MQAGCCSRQTRPRQWRTGCSWGGTLCAPTCTQTLPQGTPCFCATTCGCSGWGGSSSSAPRCAHQSGLLVLPHCPGASALLAAAHGRCMCPRHLLQLVATGCILLSWLVHGHPSTGRSRAWLLPAVGGSRTHIASCVVCQVLQCQMGQGKPSLHGISAICLALPALTDNKMPMLCRGRMQDAHGRTG